MLPVLALYSRIAAKGTFAFLSVVRLVAFLAELQMA